jgi:hypothetical protein
MEILDVCDDSMVLMEFDIPIRKFFDQVLQQIVGYRIHCRNAVWLETEDYHATKGVMQMLVNQCGRRSSIQQLQHFFVYYRQYMVSGDKSMFVLSKTMLQRFIVASITWEKATSAVRPMQIMPLVTTSSKEPVEVITVSEFTAMVPVLTRESIIIQEALTSLAATGGIIDVCVPARYLHDFDHGRTGQDFF